jgi:hypothetical protein
VQKFVDKYILPKFSHKKGNFDIVYKFGGSDISMITSPRDEQTYHLHKRVNTYLWVPPKFGFCFFKVGLFDWLITKKEEK